MKDAQIEALVRASSDLVGTLDEEQVIAKIVREAASVLDAMSCSVILLDEASDECFFYSASKSSDELRHIRFNRELGVVGKVLSTGKPVLVANTERDPNHYRGVDQRTGTKTQSLIAVPLHVKDRIIGVVEAVNKRSAPCFSDDDLQLLVIFSNFAAVALHNARTFGRCRNEVAAFRDTSGLADIYLGGSASMKLVWHTIHKIAPTASTVMITGESGCGKEVVANAIHRAGPRAEHPCVCVNCAALDPNLLASELFGHEKGAYTGAVEQRFGRFELARDGTIFLDEIGDAELSVQARLLRVLETHRFERLGSSESRVTDARVIAATNVDLAAAVKNKTFRQDLYHRLNVVSIAIPPLRERTDDIPGFLDFFSRKLSREMKMRPIHFSPKAVEALLAYSWPGNIRELKNMVERCTALADGDEISLTDLSLYFPMLRPEPHPSSSSAESGDPSLWEREKRAIEEALTASRGNQSEAARKLGIARYHLLYRIKKYGIQT